MPLNASGAISLGGATAGQSVALELGLSGTAQITFNCTTVRTLAGVASGAIALNNFYGKSSGPTVGVFYAGQTSGTTWVNTTSRINACGTIIGAQTAIGTARYRAAGAGMPTNAMFWGGGTSGATTTNSAVRINACGALVGSQTTPSTIPAYAGLPAGGKLGNNGVYYAPYSISPPSGYCSSQNNSVRLNACGGLVGQNITITAFCRQGVAGAVAGSSLVVYGGDYNPCPSCCSSSLTTKITRINACGNKIAACLTPAVTASSYQAGAPIGGNAVFFGYVTGGGRVTRINACGAVVGSQTTITPNRQSAGGAAIGTNGVYYGGCLSNTVTRINACGAVVGGATTVGTARSGPAGAGI